MARKRKRNPQKNYSGTGAFIGSLVGVTPGSLYKSPALALAGSVAGGAIGGYYGAKADRQKRGSLGGGIGGVFGPLGAALGGYIGGRRPDGPESNPAALTTAVAVGLGIAAVGAGYGAYRYTQKRKALGAAKKPAAELTPAEALQGILGSSTLADAPLVVDDVMHPIVLQTGDLAGVEGAGKVPELRVLVERPDGESKIEEPAGAMFVSFAPGGAPVNEVILIDKGSDRSVFPTSQTAISYLVPGLSPEYARLAYELALVHIAEKGVDWDDSEQRDAATQQILQTIAPKLDWSKGLKPYTYGDAAWKAWVGVQIMGVVASQSFYNKRAMRR